MMALTREDLQHALSKSNVRAFLRVIREGETDQTGNAYRKLVGDLPGVYSLTSLKDHPRRVVWIDSLKVMSSAAGAYQFLTRTWDEMAQQYGFEDFGSACQDEAATGLLLRRKSLGAIIAGDLKTALEKCSYEWASLPPGRYGQPIISEFKAMAVYEKWGGSYSDPDA